MDSKNHAPTIEKNHLQQQKLSLLSLIICGMLHFQQGCYPRRAWEATSIVVRCFG